MTNNFNGTIKKIYRKNHYTGKTIFGVETDAIDVKRNRNGLVVCEGVIPNWPEELSVLITGEWDLKNANCMIESITPITKTKEESKKLFKTIIKELRKENLRFKCSNQNQKEFLECMGDDLLNFIENEKSMELLQCSTKIELWKLELIRNKLIEIPASISLLRFLSFFECNINVSAKLFKKYGEAALTTLKAHPYKAGSSIGIDFYTLDKIGKHQGIDPLDKDRVSAIIYEALNSVMNSTGSTYVTQPELLSNINKVARKSSFPTKKIPKPYIGTIMAGLRWIVSETVENEIHICRSDYYNAEVNISKNLKRLNQQSNKVIPEIEIEKVIHRNEKSGIKYSLEQKEAFKALLTTGIKIITGGPGVGKTTTINGLITAYLELCPGKKIALAAPTGRAAQLMAYVTEMEAKTIHKLLDFKPYQKEGEETATHRNAENPIDADLIIIDEMSMVDTKLFDMLLEAIKTETILILLGDKDQLQSVSPGNVFHDLMKSKIFAEYHLTKVYRQKGDNTIIENAYKILAGNSCLTNNDKFSITQVETEAEAKNLIKHKFQKAHKSKGIDNIQILSPINKAELGTISINNFISNIVRENIPAEAPIFYFGKMSYTIGDKIIFHRNNYTKDYRNGAIGYIKNILKNGIEVELDGEIKEIIDDELNDVSLAYAITVHKSQGSEFENIIVVLPDTYKNMLNRNLLFTAVTRPKESITIIAINNALHSAINTVIDNNRNTGLTNRIKKVMIHNA